MNITGVFARKIGLVGLLLCSVACASSKPWMSDTFTNTLSKDWRWLDEDPTAWNLIQGRLNMRRYPGNGFYGNVRVPVLYRPDVPYDDNVEVRAQVKAGFDVDRKYGQAGIIFFYDNEHFAKFVIEYWWEKGIHVIFLKEEDGKPCHEKDICEKDVFLGDTSVELRIRHTRGQFITEYRKIGSTVWIPHFTVPAIANKGPIHVGLFSQADSGSNDWAWFDDFSLTVAKASVP